MSQSDDAPSPESTSEGTPSGDPWLAFGYLVAGVLLYGGIGFLLDRWWGTRFMVVIGILLGAGLAIYQTFARFKAPTGPS